ncbi:arginase family protein [candidate division KSB1 bacterium]|nr:arginase family protein [candidate division KSB1 bacterium]
MSIRIIQVPYDSGIRDQRMGRGPSHFIANGLVDRLQEIDESVTDIIAESKGSFPTEVGTTFELQREISNQVKLALAHDQFPLILSGNCSSTVGALAGFESRNLALIWFDAHGDFNTPETTTSGFLDGMALSIIVGHCWKSLAQAIPGFRPLAENRVAMVGSRDLDAAEELRLKDSQIKLARYEQIQDSGTVETLNPILDKLSGSVEGVYLHIDMDVLNPDFAPVNSYQPPEGLSPEQMQEIIESIAAKFPISGASVTAYDPEMDPENKGLAAGLDLISLIVKAVLK